MNVLAILVLKFCQISIVYELWLFILYENFVKSLYCLAIFRTLIIFYVLHVLTNENTLCKCLDLALSFLCILCAALMVGRPTIALLDLW